MPDAPDDERKRRRLGDETKSRIADLASGWTTEPPGGLPTPDPDADQRATPDPDRATPDPDLETRIDPKRPVDRATPDPDLATEPTTALPPVTANNAASAPVASERPKRKTNPPPPPGSPERKALEEKIIATSKDEREDETVPRPPTGAQPIVRPPGGQTGSQPNARPMAGQTGSQPNARPPAGQTGSQPVAGDRAKPKTSPPPPPGSPERAKGLTGPQQILGERSKSTSTPPPSPGSPGRPKGSTGQVPVPTLDWSVPSDTIVDPKQSSSPPTSSAPPPPPSSPGRAKGSTGERPILADRATSPADRARSPAGADRAKGSTGERPSLADRATSPASAERPIIRSDSSPIEPGSARPKSPSWPPPRPAADRSKPSSVSPIPSSAASAIASSRSRPASIPPALTVAASTPERIGDDTKARIAELASGWSADPAAESGPPPTASGSLQAQQLPDQAPKTGPRHPRAGYQGADVPFQTESKTFSSEQRTPPVIVDSSLSTPDLLAAASAAANTPIPAGGPTPKVFPGNSTSRIVAGTPRPAVPKHEFDSSSRTLASGPPEMASQRVPSVITPVEDLLEDDDVRDATPTPMPLPIPPSGPARRPIGASTAERDDATKIDPQTNRFERGDPTVDGSPDATAIEPPTSGRKRQLTGGTLRPSAALRRKRGLWGDVRYVFTAVFGVRRARREVEELEHRQELRQTSRKRHLVTLGRTAVVTDAFDHPALGKARDQLQRVEEERGKHAGAVAASDAELERVRRDRETKAKELLDLILTTDGELAELAKKLEPLEKEAAVAKRRAQELRETVQKLDKKIADTEALKVSVKGEKMDKAAIQADVVTYKADKEAVLRDEPVIAAQLDALNPRIAAIEASRAELLKKKLEAQKAEDEDQKRTSELLAAIGAKRKVVERAAAEAEQARDATLLELGDKLYVDRPKSLATLLSPIDAIDLELGEGDRRIMELREILSNIDRWKFSRGLAMIIVALSLAACFVWWLIAMLT